MLKKIFHSIVIVVALSVLLISTSRTFMERISGKRNNVNAWWGAFQGQNGDLVNMAYLGFIEKFRTDTNLQAEIFHKRGKDNIDLFLKGDSYTRSISPNGFSYLRDYHFCNRWQKDFTYQLNPSRKSVLILEITERYFREYYNDLKVFDDFSKAGTKKKLDTGDDTERVMDFSLKNLFNKNINQNIQYNLFNYNFLVPVFESKAALNYSILGRASGDVVVSDDGNFLFLKETMAPFGTRSAYMPVSANDVTLYVKNLNAIYDHYKAEGFTEVLFSLIPNPVTILQPGNYNNLIPLIQNDLRLRMEIIDVYSVFKKNSSTLYYLPGDSHWNKLGEKVWLDLVNPVFERIIEGDRSITTRY